MSRVLIALSAVLVSCSLLALQIVGAIEATEGASAYTRASMIVAMITVALLPVFVHVAWHYRLRVLAASLLIAFVALLAYSLPAVVGRTGEIKAAKAAAGADRVEIERDLRSTTTRLEWARTDWQNECRTGAGPQCRGKGQTVQALESRVEKLRGELKTAAHGDLGSEAWAWASMGHVTADTIRRASVLAFAVGLDVAIWALVWLATAIVSAMVSERRARTVSTVSTVSKVSKVSTPLIASETVVAAPETVAGSKTPETVSPAREVSARARRAAETDYARELDALRKLLAQEGRPLTNNDVARLSGVTKGEASKRVSAAIAAGMVSRERVGREVAITLH